LSSQILVLHFGAHKTATSVIQRYLRDNPELMEENKIAFLLRSESDGLIGWGGNVLDAGIARLRAKIDDAFDSGAAYFILSHENTLGRPFKRDVNGLYPNREGPLKKLAEAFSIYPKRVIYYIRSQEEFLESYYLQKIHEGGTQTFKQWSRQINVESLSWRPVIESLQRAFGSNEVVVKDFAVEMANGQQEYLKRAFATFHQNLEPSRFSDFEYSPLHNISIGTKGLEIALAINRFAQTPEERTKVRHFIQRNFSNLQYPRPTLLSEEEKGRIKEFYAEENSALTHEG
jgi:hypothetical protein